MNRRRFLKDAAQLGTSLGIADSFLGNQATAAPTPRPTVAQEPRQKAKFIQARHQDGLLSGTPVMSLDGQWLVATDPQNAGRAHQWYASALRGGTPTRVPGIIQEAFPAYHGVAWYEREFLAPAHPHAQGRYLVRFGAVDYLADVWVNGVHVGAHEGGETPFVLDVTNAIQPKASNRLAVRVLNPTNEPIDGIVLDQTPHLCKVVSYWNGNLYDYGGIIGSVELLMAPAVRVENLFVRPDWKTGKMRIQANARNAASKTMRGDFQFSVAPAARGETLRVTQLERELPPGDTLIEAELQVENPRLWDLEDPFLYRLTAQVQATEADSSDEVSVRCGFRDFRVVNGYFRLNGKRIFLRGTLTLSHCPVGQIIPPSEAPDLLRRDVLYMKASGFQIVRFVGVAQPYQLDLCDEIGLMIQEESFAAWKLDDSPKMKERFDRSTREMILRDRNHPSITMWELLNEVWDGPVFRHAVDSLKLVRSLDDTRVVMLSSGRFDGDFTIGSVSNPGSSEWEYVWGKEEAGAARVATRYPSPPGAGSFHIYPQVPQTAEANRLIRTLGQDSKPVFLAEYGIGSLKDVIFEAQMYEQVGARQDLEDFTFMRTMAERFVADWNRFGMEGVYSFP